MPRNYDRRMRGKPVPKRLLEDKGEEPVSMFSSEDVKIGPLEDDDVYSALGVPDTNFYEASELTRITSNPQGQPEPAINPSELFVHPTPEPPPICVLGEEYARMCHYSDESSYHQVDAGIVNPVEYADTSLQRKKTPHGSSSEHVGVFKD